MTAPTDVTAHATRPLRLALEIVPAILVLGALLWQLRGILTPLLLFPLLCVMLWPHRNQTTVTHLLLTAGTLTAVWFLVENGALLAPFVLALAIAYFVAPAVGLLERRRVPRSLAIVLVLLPFLVALALLLVLLLPAVERQLVTLASQLPGLIRRTADWALALRTRFLASSGNLLTPEQAAWLQNLQPSDLVGMVDAQWSDIARRIWSALMGIGRGVGAVLSVLGYLVVTPVVTYYLLKSWTRFTAKLEDLVPPSRRDAAFGFLGEYDRLLGRFLRGQLIEATLVAVLTGGALAVLGFPGAVLVGVIAGVGNLVPYVGLPISVIPGILFALVSEGPLTALLKLFVVFGVVQFIDGSVTGPRIVGESVGLNPVWVMIALVLAGSLLGFVGLLVAVPLAVLVKMLVSRALARYKASGLYQEA